MSRSAKSGMGGLRRAFALLLAAALFVSPASGVLMSASAAAEPGAFPEEALILDGTTVTGVQEEYKAGIGTAYTKLVIPDTVTCVGESAFESLAFSEVVFSESVTSISDYAFYACDSLAGVTIPGNVGTIGVGAFSFCASLNSVTLLYGVTSIRYNAFSDCPNLAEVSASPSIQGVEDDIFGFNDQDLLDAAKALELHAPADSAVYTYYTAGNDNTRGLVPQKLSDDSPVLFEYAVSGGGVEIIQYHGEADAAAVRVPDTINGDPVTAIGDNAFSGRGALKAVTLPETVKSIGNGSFQSTGLERAVLPASVERIGDQAFADCAGLTDVTVQNPSAVFGNSVFSGHLGDLTLCGYPGSTTEAYASTASTDGSLQFVNLHERNDHTVTVSDPAWLAVSAAEAGFQQEVTVSILRMDDGAELLDAIEVRADGFQANKSVYAVIAGAQEHVKPGEASIPQELWKFTFRMPAADVTVSARLEPVTKSPVLENPLQVPELSPEADSPPEHALQRPGQGPA